MLQPKMILFFLSFCLSFRLYIKQHSMCWEFDCMRFPNDHRIFGNVNELRSLHTNVYSIVYRTFWIWTQERIANTMNHVAHSLFLIYIISAAFVWQIELFVIFLCNVNGIICSIENLTSLWQEKMPSDLLEWKDNWI